ncbi:MAG: hypothetical protein M3N51_10650 [Actinomycetota bacterium]|nr:hypothetical protein [Actinomycetota bacterium]
MNRHAEKLLEGPYGDAPEHPYEDEEGFNPLLHGVVIQIYACPQCGKGEALPASH